MEMAEAYTSQLCFSKPRHAPPLSLDRPATERSQPRSVSRSQVGTGPEETGPYLGPPVRNVHAGPAEHNEEVHAVDTDAGVVPGIWSQKMSKIKQKGSTI